MKYSCSIDIHLPRDRVVALFDDTANLKRWMPGLRAFEHQSGIPGEVGAKSRLTFKDGAREFAMTETVTLRQLPERFDGTYEMPGVHNAVQNRFIVVGAEHTRWEQDTEFRFDGLMMKLMALVAPGMFRKQTMSFMEKFKEFAESQTDEGLERTRFEPQ